MKNCTKKAICIGFSKILLKTYWIALEVRGFFFIPMVVPEHSFK